MKRQNIASGSPYESEFGFSRAVKVRHWVKVAGTAPIWPDGSVDSDPGVQARRCIEIMLEALAEVDGKAEDVIRTRMFITDPTDADAVGQAHGDVFSEIRPAATMVVVAGLLDERWKVEMELDAHLTG
ncbi:MAG: RidA family protein [Actinomycetota bacterium]|nr:RidA family protein [Actinomycetota bacterium]